MRKLFLTVAIATMSVAMNAQIGNYFVKAGLNVSSYSKGDNDAKLGWKLGVGGECVFNPNVSLQSGLFVSAKGITGGSEVDGMAVDLTMNAIYLELPVNALLRVPFGEQQHVVFTAGPYLAYGVGGDYTIKAEGEEVSWGSFGNRTVAGQYVEGLKRFDAGFGCGIGIEFDKFLVGLEGEFGMIGVAGEESAKNRNFSLAISYRF
jgi:hypothetical protein